MPPPPTEIITKAQIEEHFPGVPDADGWVLAVEAAIADAEAAFREKAGAGGWQPWLAQPAHIDAASPWWEAGAEYVWTVVQAHTTASNKRGQSPARFEAFLSDEIPVLCDVVFRQKLLPTSSGRPMWDSPDGLAFLFYVRDRIRGRLQELLRDAWKAQAVKLNAPASGTKPERKAAGPRGPKPDVENCVKVLDIVERVCGDGGRSGWKGKLDEIANELDDAKIPIPKAWRTRKDKPVDWADALDQNKKTFVQAIEYRVKQATILT